MPKLKRHECKSIREYNKLIRKYIKYFRNKDIRKRLWYTWIWVDILDPWDKSLYNYAKRLHNQGHVNLGLIMKEVQDNYGWSFTDSRYEDSEFKLTGIEISNEDYYYIYINSSGQKQYMTCVGRFTDIKR